MPDLGIGETLGAIFGGGDLLAGLFGGGAAATDAALGAGALDTGLATIGAGAADAGAAAAGGGGLADIVGTGAGLFGGTTGLEGTALAGGVTGGIPELLGAGGATALGTAADFMAAPGASGFAAPGAGFGAAPVAGGGTTAIGPSSTLPSGVANANAGASVFDTGTSPLTGTGSGFSPGGAGASGVSAPTGVGGVPDATAAAGQTADATAQGAGQAAGQAATKSTSISDLLSKLGNGAVDSVIKNPLPTALGAAGLGYNILQGEKQTANQKALSADAAQATQNSNNMVAQGQALQQYLTNGTLPPAYMQQVDQAINDAKTRAISNAAAQGLPTDPTKNSSLAATLAGIDNQRSSMVTQVASQLFSSGQGLINSGQSAAGLSGNLYQALVQNDTSQAANMGKAIATLAAALNGKSQNSAGGITISTG